MWMYIAKYNKITVIICLPVELQNGASEEKSKTLGQQAAMLSSAWERVVALQRMIYAAQVLVAREVVMRALSLVSVR